jgi:hypothetical protein
MIFSRIFVEFIIMKIILFFNSLHLFKSYLFKIYVCIKKAFFIKYSSTYNINSIDLIDNICI